MTISKKQRLWIYGGAGLVGVFLLYRWYAAKSAAAATSATAAQDQGGNLTPADFATLSGQEQGDVAALQNEIAGLFSSSSATTPTATDTGGGVDLSGITDTLSQILNKVSAGQIAPPASTNGAGAAAVNTPIGPPAAASTPKPAAPTIQSGSWAPATVPQQIQLLLAQGFHKIAGTTQKGGLGQTGTYVKGGSKYFVWGTSATGLQIRKAA